MPSFNIDSLHDGMNLRDQTPQILPGETQESVGLDFSIPGVVKPMREGLLAWTLPADILDGHIVYLAQVEYLFTTHADGLRVTTGAVTTLIDPAFTGTFKIIPINDEYVVMTDGTRQRKWKPGWPATFEWGLNTPPDPVLSIGTGPLKMIDDFELIGNYYFVFYGVTLIPAAGNIYTDSNGHSFAINGIYSAGIAPNIGGYLYVTGTVAPAVATDNLTRVTGAGDASITYYGAITSDSWTFTGGGAGGAMLVDTVNFKTGTQSMKLVCDQNDAIIATKAVSLDLTYFTIPGDAVSYLAILLSFFTDHLENVNSIVLRLSCAANGAFTDDYYKMTITVGGYNSAQLVESEGGLITSVQSTAVTSTTVPYVLKGDVPPGDTPTQKKYDLQTTLAAVTLAISSKWTDLNMLVTDFLRVGTAVGRDWSTITAIQIELAAMNGQAAVSFDTLELGGSNLLGSYWLAVAYQNALGNYGPYSNYVGPITVNAQAIGVSNLVPDADPQTVKRRFAIVGGGLTDPMVSYLDNNIDNSTNFNDPVAALTEVEQYFNNKKPPVGLDMVSGFGRIWVVNGDNTLMFSEPLMFEGFPLQNQIILSEGEQLKQVAIVGNYIAARGKDQEHLIQLTGDTPAYWQLSMGAKEGAISSRLLLKDITGGQVWASKLGFYISDSYYLPKINPVVADFSQVFGDRIGDRAFLWFQDKGGVGRVMQIDYRLGKPVAHYVGNFNPSAIFADRIVGKAYYALADKIYEFDAGALPLPTKLVIPGQLCQTTALKDFAKLDYSLTGAPLPAQLVVEDEVQAGALTLPLARRHNSPVSLPLGTVGTSLGMILTTTTEDFILDCPIEIEQVAV